MDKRVKIWLYSDCPGNFINPLQDREYKVEITLQGVSPFAIVGERENSMQHFGENCNNVSTNVSLKKIFPAMISRDSSSYESNFKILPYGKLVDYSNPTDYFIVYFTNLLRPLYKIGEAIYSPVFPRDDFHKELEKHPKTIFPFSESFNWKYYMEKIANAVIQNYDSEHIILIRCYPSDWRISEEKKEITSPGTWKKQRDFLREAEDYFIQITHCQCVNRLMDFLPNKAYFIEEPFAFESVIDEIDKIIKQKKKSYCNFYEYHHPVIQRLVKRLTYEKHMEIRQDLMNIDGEVTPFIKKTLFHNHSSKFYRDLQLLNTNFMEFENNLTDYFKLCEKNNEVISIELLQLYTEYFKITVDDIMMIFSVYCKIEKKELLRKTVENICRNRDCYPLMSTLERVENNKRYLMKYSYLDDELKKEVEALSSTSPKVYILRIAENVFMSLDYDSNELMLLTEWKERNPNPEDIISREMRCEYADFPGLSKNLRFYVLRSQKNLGNTPLKVVFRNTEEFKQSLSLIDYEEILESENAFLLLEKNIHCLEEIYNKTYRSVCNLDILVNGDCKIFQIRDGMVDQLRYYSFSKLVEKISGAGCIYDDMWVRRRSILNGIAVKPDIDDDVKTLRSQYENEHGEDFFKFICGKFLFTSLFVYLRSVIKENFKKDDLKWCLIQCFDISKLDYVGKTVDKIFASR